MSITADCKLVGGMPGMVPDLDRGVVEMDHHRDRGMAEVIGPMDLDSGAAKDGLDQITGEILVIVGLPVPGREMAASAPAFVHDQVAILAERRF